MKPASYNRNNVIKDTADRIPTDRAYVIKLGKAEAIESKYGTRLEIEFDIAEGDFFNYYHKQYEANTNEDKKYKGVFRLNVPEEGDTSDMAEWGRKQFNTCMAAVEDSNPGYSWNWDENTLAGKFAGLLYRDKEWEYNGKSGWFSEPFRFISVDDAKNGNYKLPKKKALKKDASVSKDDSFLNVSTTSEEEIPW